MIDKYLIPLDSYCDSQSSISAYTTNAQDPASKLVMEGILLDFYNGDKMLVADRDSMMSNNANVPMYSTYVIRGFNNDNDFVMVYLFGVSIEAIGLCIEKMLGFGEGYEIGDINENY